MKTTNSSITDYAKAYNKAFRKGRAKHMVDGNVEEIALGNRIKRKRKTKKKNQ